MTTTKGDTMTATTEYVPTVTWGGHAVHAQASCIQDMGGETLCGHLGYRDQARHLVLSDVTCKRCLKSLNREGA